MDVVKTRMTKDKACKAAMRLLQCDAVEIERYCNVYFLFAFNKRSGDYVTHTGDKAEETKTYFDYMDGSTIASGRTLRELLDEVKFYVKLKNSTRPQAWYLYLRRRGMTKRAAAAFRDGFMGFGKTTHNE